jgi:hypothetical protein
MSLHDHNPQLEHHFLTRRQVMAKWRREKVESGVMVWSEYQFWIRLVFGWSGSP